MERFDISLLSTKFNATGTLSFATERLDKRVMSLDKFPYQRIWSSNHFTVLYVKSVIVEGKCGCG